MNNLGQLMKQAKEMQGRMAELQERLAKTEVEGASGAGMVTATMNGKGELKQLKIDPALIDADEIEVLEDLIVAACADAKTKVEAVMAEEMQQITGGLPIPPGLNPF